MERALGDYLAHAPIFVRTLKGEIIYWTLGAEELYGFTSREAVGRISHDLLQTVFPTELGNIDAELQSRSEWRGRLRHTGRNGKLVWTESLWKLRDGDIVVEQSTDVSNRVELESQRELLILELDHRVRNTLTVVQALARLTFKDTNLQAVRQFDQRLSALSEAHAVLTATHWTGASLKEIIARTVGAFDIQKKISVEGPDADLEPKAALCYAMALHELCTNAIKHGALRVPEGRIDIRWSIADQSRIHLIWKESGGPPATPSQAEGFGSRLIRDAISTELGTPVEMRFDAGGFVCEFDGPLQKSASVITDE